MIEQLPFGRRVLIREPCRRDRLGRIVGVHVDERDVDEPSGARMIAASPCRSSNQPAGATNVLPNAVVSGVSAASVCACELGAGGAAGAAAGGATGAAGGGIAGDEHAHSTSEQMATDFMAATLDEPRAVA